MEGAEFPVEFNPDMEAPAVYVAHYNVFSRRRKKKQQEEEEEEEFSMQSELEKVLADLDKESKQKAPKKEPVLPELQKFQWDIIVLDEAHRIKTKTTGWTREIKRLKGTVRHVMTGTGFINEPAELWSLLNFLNKHEYSSYWRFREKFCAEDVINGYRKIIGVNPEAEDEFKKLVRQIGPRRTKHEVFKNLPEPIYTNVEVDLNSTQRRMYDSIRDELYAMDEAGTPLYAPNVLSALQRLRQVCVATPRVVADFYDPVTEKRKQTVELVEPSSKLDALMEVIDGLEWDEERRDQIVVFSNFKDPIELAKRRFDKAGITYMEMTTKDNDSQRYQKWAIEFPKKNYQVFICTLQLGSESISLTSASTCVFLDRSWSPKDNEQGVSRVWRPGQEQAANIIFINAKYTVDNRIMRMNAKKIGWFKSIFG